MPGSEVQELGLIFRQARLRKGVSLTQAQQATKIRQSFLTALEEENYSILPPPVYVRGFIKIYASYLKLDPPEMVRLFDDLMDNVAAGIEPYQSGYGSSDSGGMAALPAANPQMLAGLTQSEARMVERSTEIINLNPLNNVTNDKPAIGIGSADSGSGYRPARRGLNDLRVPQKYVLKPAIAPISKPSFYMPSFMPVLLVVIIVGAAFLLIYRGLVLPPTKSVNEASTATTGNVYSKPTVTALPTGDTSDFAALPISTATPSTRNLTPPPFYTPDQALVAPNATPKAGTTVSLPAAVTAVPTTQNTPALSPTPTIAGQTIKVEVSTFGQSSWLTVTVDEQSKYNQILPAGQTQIFEGKRISIRAGAPGYVKVKVNGQEKQYAPPASDIITHVWDVNGEDTIIK